MSADTKIIRVVNLKQAEEEVKIYMKGPEDDNEDIGGSKRVKAFISKNLKKEDIVEEVEELIQEDVNENIEQGVEVETILPAKKKQPFVPNQKQKEFVDHIVLDLMTPTDAYMAVYKDATRRSANVASSRLLSNQGVKDLLASRSSELKVLSHIPKHQILLKLKGLLDRVDKDNNHKYIVEYIDMICKLMGYYHQPPVQPTSQTNTLIQFGDFTPEPAPPAVLSPPVQTLAPGSIRTVDISQFNNTTNLSNSILKKQSSEHHPSDEFARGESNENC